MDTKVLTFKTVIVLLSGKQGSGKSTLARNLVEAYNERKKNWEAFEFKFAGAIYDMHDQCLSFLRSYGIDAPKKDGKLLQLLGTDWGRMTYGPDIWVNVMKGIVAECEEDRKRLGFATNLLLVISDCRFQNEFDAFPDALRVRLQAGEEIRRGRAESWREATNHASEIDLDGYAGQGLFDLYLDSETLKPAWCTDLTAAQIDKGNWVERRTRGK